MIDDHLPVHWRVLRAKTMFREVHERSTTGQEELLSVLHITGATPRSQKSHRQAIRIQHLAILEFHTERLRSGLLNGPRRWRPWSAGKAEGRALRLTCLAWRDANRQGARRIG
jgi:hypothetical protein